MKEKMNERIKRKKKILKKKRMKGEIIEKNERKKK